MIDTFLALMGRRFCPWCNLRKRLGWFERWYNEWPVWLVRLEMVVNQFWRPGRWWHYAVHERRQAPRLVRHPTTLIRPPKRRRSR